MSIIYVHGFNSSPESSKCVQLMNYCLVHEISCDAPKLPHRPKEAVDLLETMVADRRPHLLVGSSMGGYYATWLCEKHDVVKAVLINPAVRIAELLRSEVGSRQRNYHDEEEYDFTEEHLKEFADLEVRSIRDPSKYLLLVQKGDELLDYQQAVEFYAGCDQAVEEGGNHMFDGFDRHLKRIADLALRLGAG